MSIQFGRLNTDGKPTEPEYVEAVKSMLAPYGPDRADSYTKVGITILYHAFCTTAESRTEEQPMANKSGVVITWDGRLDNRTELCSLLGAPLSLSSPDISFVAAAYERWGRACFSKLVGDWASPSGMLRPAPSTLPRM